MADLITYFLDLLNKADLVRWERKKYLLSLSRALLFTVTWKFKVGLMVYYLIHPQLSVLINS